MKLVLKILIISFICFSSCKKDEKTVTCPSQHYYQLEPLIKQFYFKKNSYWVLKNSFTNALDTLKTYYSTGAKISFGPGTSKECKGDKYEGAAESFYHSMLPGGSSSIDFLIDADGIRTEYYKFCACNQLSFYEKNIGDSILFNNNTNWSKIENIYSSILINGNTYTNVYQMFYYPDLYGFNRIWWCPNIGFVKFEYYNTINSQTEFWELDSYNVQLY